MSVGKRVLPLLTVLVTGLAGCALPATDGSSRTALIPEGGEVRVASDLSYTTKELVAAPVTLLALNGILDKSLDQLLPFTQPILLYFVYQPFAPNWSVEEARLNEDTYYLRLQAKRFRTGGDGEALSVLRKRAQLLQHAGGYSAYRLLDYSEGIESGTPVAQRYSHGIVQLVRADAPATSSGR